MRAALATSATAIGTIARVPVRGMDSVELKYAAIELQRQIDQLTVQQARVMFEADRTHAWQGSGARSIADWLAGKTKSSYGAAKKKQKLGNSMNKNPKLDDAVTNGELSPDAATELADTIDNPPPGADPDELIDACKGATPNQARDAAERWKETHKAETEEAAEARRFAARSLRSTVPIDGQITITATMPTLQARQVLKVCSFLGGKPSATDTRSTAQRMCDGLILLADAYAKGEVRGGREKPTLLITIPIDSYTGNSNEPGVTDFGDRIPAHIVRRLADNANLQRVLITGSQILDLGRSERYATLDQYKALLARDGGCRVDDCNIPGAWCDIDHLIAWEHGGSSDLDNLGLLCTHHHHVKHLPGARVTGTIEEFWIHLPDGTTLHCPPANTHTRTTQAAA
ncbi:MAG: DUF222 domain-containing protein [Phycisphaerales bacterium]